MNIRQNIVSQCFILQYVETVAIYILETVVDSNKIIYDVIEECLGCELYLGEYSSKEMAQNRFNQLIRLWETNPAHYMDDYQPWSEVIKRNETINET